MNHIQCNCPNGDALSCSVTSCLQQKNGPLFSVPRKPIRYAYISNFEKKTSTLPNVINVIILCVVYSLLHKWVAALKDHVAGWLFREFMSGTRPILVCYKHFEHWAFLNPNQIKVNALPTVWDCDTNDTTNIIALSTVSII